MYKAKNSCKNECMIRYSKKHKIVCKPCSSYFVVKVFSAKIKYPKNIIKSTFAM